MKNKYNVIKIICRKYIVMVFNFIFICLYKWFVMFLLFLRMFCLVLIIYNDECMIFIYFF